MTNLTKFKIYKAFSGITKWWLAIIVIFYAESGLNYEQIGALLAVTAVTVLLTEVPAGSLADKYGRKYLLALSQLAIILSALIFMASDQFWLLLVACAFYGLQKSFESGADTAFLYDYLQNIGRGGSFKEISGLVHSVYMLSLGLSFVLVGYIYKLSPEAVFICSILTGLVSLFISLSFSEPIIEKNRDKVPMDLNAGLKTITKSKVMLSLVIFSALFVAYGDSIYKLNNLYMDLVGVPVEFYGWLFASSFIVSAVFSRYAYLIERKIGKKVSLLLIPLGYFVIYLIMGVYVTLFALVLQVFTAVFAGFKKPVIDDYMNQLIDSKHRATVISMSSMVTNLFTVFISLGLGTLALLFGVAEMHFLSAVMFGILIIIPTYLLVTIRE